MGENALKPNNASKPPRAVTLADFLHQLRQKIDGQEYHGDEKPKAELPSIKQHKLYPRKQARLARENRRSYEQLGAVVGADPIGAARDALGRRRWMSANEFGAAVVYGFLAVVCERMNLELRDVLRQISRQGGHVPDPQWRAASLARRFASYLTRTECVVGLRPIARAFNLTEASVCIGCREIEKLRDDEMVDKLLDGATEILLRGVAIPIDDRWAALKPKQSSDFDANQQG